VNRRLIGGLALAGACAIGIGAWEGASAWQQTNTTALAPTMPLPDNGTQEKPATPAPAQPRPDVEAPLAKNETPMKDRVAVLGLLNKRNGLSRDLKMRPGESVRVGDVIVRLRACDTTAPWEHEQLTGAFVQVDVHGRGKDDSWKRVFSGWLYKESPSLNVVEHPVYDVWPKSCEMKHPEIGPDTIVASGPDSSPAKRSRAKKSPATGPTPTPSAASNKAT
jgi:hypothetical protein